MQEDKRTEAVKSVHQTRPVACDPPFDLHCAFRSAGFSFLFSWLLMAIVVVLFLVGGNFYTLGCKPWYNGELLKVETCVLMNLCAILKYSLE